MAAFFRREHWVVGLAVPGFVLAGCVYHQQAEDAGALPLVPAAGHYAEGGGRMAPGVRSEAPEWWKSFRSRELNRLESQATQSNLELAQFGARLRQAEASQRQAGARLFPLLDADGRYAASRVDGQRNRVKNSESTGAALGLLLQWEVDVWGRLRAGREAAREDTEAARFDLAGARLFLSAAVAEAYFQVIEQLQQSDLLTEQIETGKVLLGLTQLRFGQGQASLVDVLQQREQLASTRARVPLTEAELKRLEYVLDVLTGRSPGDRPLTASRAFPRVSVLDGLGIPSDLLAQRPDLRAEQRRLAALDYRIAEAVADRLPRFTIDGSAAVTGGSNVESLVSSAVAGVVAPLFDAGERKAELVRRMAVYEEALYRYSQAYLEAVREVETALLGDAKQREHVALLEKQLNTAERLLRETRIRYSQGLTDYLPVLASVNRVQELQRDAITARRQLLSLRVLLHRALGGNATS